MVFPRPAALRDLDEAQDLRTHRPQHKQFAEQLMADFPDMRFILVGDDESPTTYATIARRYPGRVLAIVISWNRPRESTSWRR